MKKPKRCTKCGSKKIAKILFGLPTYSPELKRQLEAGEIVLGGCIITSNDSKWECVKCWERIRSEFPSQACGGSYNEFPEVKKLLSSILKP